MYRVDTSGEATDQIANLPDDALLAYAEAAVVLELAPWNGLSVNKRNPDAPLRQLVFGSFGMITYLVVEQERLVSVIRVQWVG
ncbi:MULTISPECIES: hypothetical protein [unclassified Nocardia]|uniref:hypothetical protein n=1 Tax=unclassified Nocardia TaxID=2637762 RepID=UPI001CE45D3F|nr:MULTISPECIES: hypothetical protein [unclassified Nocardia]